MKTTDDAEKYSVEETLDMMEDYIDRAMSLPFGNKYAVINREEFVYYINSIRQNFANDFRDAHNIMQKSKSIIDDAENRASTMIRRAEQKAAAVIETADRQAETIQDNAAKEAAESEIVQIAGKKAEEIIAEANRQGEEIISRSKEIKEQYDNAAIATQEALNVYIDDTMAELENKLRKLLAQVIKDRSGE